MIPHHWLSRPRTLRLPPMDAIAAEWGALATRIPDWRWPDGMHWSAPGFFASDNDCAPINNVRNYARAGCPTVYPDPDHWAWEGWLRRMLGDTLAHISTDGEGYVVCVIVAGDTIEGTGRTIGRAAIAAAAANGRWPGGDS